MSPLGSCSLFGVGVSGTCQGGEREGRWVSGTLSGTWARPAREAVSISVATSLTLVLAWGPALHTLPSPARVGFLAGNHGNAFVSEAWPCLPPGFSRSRGWENCFSVAARPRRLPTAAAGELGQPRRGGRLALWSQQGSLGPTPATEAPSTHRALPFAGAPVSVAGP